MKAKTRILAMLLTVLMIGGILPLSLFAADSESGSLASQVSSITPADRTYEEVKEEFEKSKVTLALYQTFQNWAFESGATTHSFAAAADQKLATNAEHNVSDDAIIRAKNVKNAYSIKTESDGNVALYLGSAASVSGGDNYIDLFLGLSNTYGNGQQGNGTHDFYVSADFKMDGPNIARCMDNNGLFGLLYRVNGGGPSIIPTVTVGEDGALYIGGTAAPDKLVGFLSDEKYTRVGVSINRSLNKFYVYINDVIVNPDGAELFTEEIVAKMNTKYNDTDTTKAGVTYDATNIPIANIRMYNVSDNTDLNVHKGLYIDNFLVGSRLAVNPTDMMYKDIFTSSFSSNLAGTNVSAPIKGTTNNTGGVILPGAVKYFAESDGSVAMQWHQMTNIVDKSDDCPYNKCQGNKSGKCECDQAYFQISNKADKGANLRLNMDLKLGADGCVGAGNFIFVRLRKCVCTKDPCKDNTLTVKLESNGKLSCGGSAIGTISKTEYSTLQIDIVCNGLTGNITALFFFNGRLALSKTITVCYGDVDGYSPTAYDPDFFRIYPIYNDGVKNLKENDLCMKNVSLIVTDDYNDASAISVFSEAQSGFVENAGITRYYDSDGKIANADFKLGNEKYLVGYCGNIIGKESDGVAVDPYFEYEDWNHASALVKSSLDGALLRSSGCLNNTRDAFAIAATIPGTGESATLYTSYYDYGAFVNDASDHNSYASWDVPAGSHVLDMDIMMALTRKQNDISDASKTVFYFVGDTVADGSGNRITGMLKMTADGWLLHEGKKIAKLSQTEFTRLSIVMNAPESGDMTFDLYLNGVKVLENVASTAGTKRIESVRFPSFYNQDISMYVKDLALYAGAKPEKFVTVSEGIAVATTDQTATPAKASDIKKGFVSENSVVRYYGEDGIVATSVNGLYNFEDANGRDYKADKNGIVYAVTNNEIAITPGHFSVDYTIDFTDVNNGDYGYATVAPNDSQGIFGLTFNNLYFASGEYTSVKIEVYLPETNKPTDVNYHFEIGEQQRFYKVEWLGGTSYKFGDGTYFVDDDVIPNGAEEVAATGTFTLENSRGGDRNIVCYDTDDIVGVSHGDKFYVRTRNYVKTLEGSSFNDLSAGWNAIEIPLVDNGEYDIDYLAFISDTLISSDYLAGVKVGTVKAVKSTRLVIDAEAEDGVSADGQYYYVDGIAQVGWIDENESGEIDADDYYASPNNAKIVVGLYSVEGVWYEFSVDGKLVEIANGIKFAKNGVDKNGNLLLAYKMFENGVIKTGLIDTGLTDEADGEKIYLYTNENGVALQNNQTYTDGEAIYGFGNDGYGKRLCAEGHDYPENGVITKVATCSETGEMTFVCNKCGTVKTEELPVDENVHKEFDAKTGLATCCEGGAKADGVTAVVGHSISIGKNVTIIYYLDITGAEGELEIGRRSEFIGETTAKIKLSELKEVTVGEKTYKTISISVAPNAVDSIVKIRYVRADGTFGTSYEYKVQEYIDQVVQLEADEIEGFTEDIIALVEAFDMYAKNVNKVLYDIGDSADIKIEDVNETTFETDNEVIWDVNDIAYKTNYIDLVKTYENISFEFGETLKLKVNFVLGAVPSDFTIRINGEEVKGTLASDGYYRVETEIHAGELDKLIVITVAHKGGAELNLKTSALGFAKRMLMSTTSTDDEKNLMKAIYKYNEAIEAYLTPDTVTE